MTAEIQKQLTQIEQEHEIRIIYACESGSRAWGFPSPDSDYDVRFIYAHKRDWYLGIDDKKDTIDLPINDLLDVNGWELRKSLRLLRGSNPPLYEWLQSPIVYREDEIACKPIKDNLRSFFSLRAGMHHYTSMVNNGLTNDLAADIVRLKKYFYVLRTLCAAIWIADKRELPPMEFSTLRDVISDSSIQKTIDELLIEKAKNDERYTIVALPDLNAFIADKLAYCNEVSRELTPAKVDTAELDKIFRAII
ncbi:MAG: nucleotidyltransferase domain-containing protein [Sphingobacteriales bacterium]|nr:MAG: nucleotidyltransferase domain-containing protein [Sphingobacteriales bacterium]